MYLLIYLSQVWAYGYLFYTLGYSLIIHYFSLNPFNFGLWELSKEIKCPFDILPIYLFSFLMLLYFLAYLENVLDSYFLCTSPKVSHFPRILSSFYWKIVFWNQDLSTECAYCWGVIASRLSLNTELWIVCMHTKDM